MNKKHSLQWKLTLITAFIVIVSCLSISYFISKSATFYFFEIEESAIAMFPKEMLSKGSDGGLEMQLNPAAEAVFSDTVKQTSVEFWTKSLLITLIIALVGSSMMYFIMGYAMKPLKKLGKQIEEIQAKNLRRPVVLDGGSIEIVRLTNAFNEMLKRLGDTFTAQRQFSANAAHELRTPLAVMRTKLEVFEKNPNPETEDYKEIMGMIRMQTDRLSHVIDLLLEMTELQSAKRSDPISLAEMAEEVICDLTFVGDKKGVRLIQKPGNAEITGNDTLVYRAIYNLIENAVKYNRPGGETVVSIQENGEFASVFVADTGAGIAKENWEQIFEPFYKVDQSRSKDEGGVGLGLALVKEIATRHGGDVRVVRSSSEGTEIELRLRKE